MKELIESMNRPGVIPVSKIQDKSTLYQGGARATYVQSQSEGNSEEEAIRALTGLVHMLGADKVQSLLGNTTKGAVEEDEWNQNFD
jgi:hypothetical protein